MSVVGLDMPGENVLVGSSSSADDVGISGYQVEANKLFRSKFEGMERQQSQNANQNAHQMNGYQDGSFNANSNSVYGQFTYDSNGQLINGSNSNGSTNMNGKGSYNGSVSGNGNMNGNVNGSTNGSSNTSGNFNNAFNNTSTNTGNRSTYSYITSCNGESFLQRLGLEGQCGGVGWTFPGLVDGNCPVTACIINVDGDTPFGPL